MLAAKTAGDQIIGFLALKFHTASAAEAYVLGVHPVWHRRGVGTKLFYAAFETARSRGARYLTVKTLAASHPDPHYRATRLFYEALGFEPIEVFPTLWDMRNPCLLMLKRLD
jgi:ribosomal protein S18 acetylase RimI-like enzyme